MINAFEAVVNENYRENRCSDIADFEYRFGRQPEGIWLAETAADTPIEMLQRYYPYIERQLGHGVPLGHMARHLLGLFHAMPNARRWRRYLSENMHSKKAGIEVLQQAERLLGDSAARA